MRHNLAQSDKAVKLRQAGLSYAKIGKALRINTGSARTMVICAGMYKLYEQRHVNNLEQLPDRLAEAERPFIKITLVKAGYIHNWLTQAKETKNIDEPQ
jgi:hypothetical protein